MSPSDLIHLASAYSVPYEDRLIEWGASPATIDVCAKREHELRPRQISELIRQSGLAAAGFHVHAERGEPSRCRE